MPLACRKSARQGLRFSLGYRGAANGLWSAELGHALVSYVVTSSKPVPTGNLTIDWQSVPGSKESLWHASAGKLACPQLPYRQRSPTSLDQLRVSFGCGSQPTGLAARRCAKLKPGAIEPTWMLRSLGNRFRSSG